MEQSGKSVVLFSAGLDSSVNLYRAKRDTEIVLALTFDYGQRASESEIRQAKIICGKLNVTHKVVKLPFLGELGGSSLTDQGVDVPQGNKVQIDDISTSQKTAKSVWVPNRNGVFLNVAAAFAESLGAQQIVPGFNLEEAQTFLDNSQAFIEAANKAFSYSTQNKISVKCYTTALDKRAIAREGVGLGLDLNDIWPCYFSGQKPCGECESCQRFYRATKGLL